MRIRGRAIGSKFPPYIVAEIGVNHNGNSRLALDMVAAAAACGADAIKLQAFKAERLLAPGRGRLGHVRESVHDFFRRVELEPEQYEQVARECRRRDVALIVTPFDEITTDMLISIGVDAFKVASGDITHHALVAHVASKGLPVILSTGASTMAEVDRALAALRGRRRIPIGLLHCVSAYPAPPAEMNLRAMQTMTDRYRLPVGLSDHTAGIHVSLAAVALGAALIEKHFTLTRDLPGPDQALSLVPEELAQLVVQSREIRSALGNGKKVPGRAERETRRQGRRGLYVVRDIGRGEVLRPADLAALRPAKGLSPEHLEAIRGRRVRRRLRAGAPLYQKDLLA